VLEGGKVDAVLADSRKDNGLASALSADVHF
jgi:hypothetical protein